MTTTRPGTFSHSRVARGPQVFVAGQVPVTPDGDPAGPTMTAQAHRVIDNIESVLAGHGAGLAEVVRVTYFLTDIALLGELREVLLARLPEPRPAASLVEVNALIDPRFLIEIDAIAVLPE